jgi:hypothetical protein
VFEPNQRVKVNLSGLTIKGVAFSQNVQEALGTIVQRVSAEPPTYLVELLFSFKGVKRVEVPEDRGERSSRARRILEATNGFARPSRGKLGREEGALDEYAVR